MTSTAPLATQTAGPWLNLSPDVFRARFNKSSFTFTHRLAGSPLFEPQRLVDLARQMSSIPNDVYFDAGDIGIGQRWDQAGKGGFSWDQALERIENAGAWIVLRRAERDPEYAAVLRSCIAEAINLSPQRLDREMKLMNAIVFITSPRRVTPYHIDRECNFLLQIRGEKTISVFRHDDRTVLPEAEIERFWTVDHNSAIYKPELQSRADVYHLAPGDGVHIPVNDPHWVQNGEGVSVSLSVNLHFRDTSVHNPCNIYRTNYFLRKAGLHPNPPGSNRAVDWTKRYGMAALWACDPLRRAVRRVVSGPAKH